MGLNKQAIYFATDALLAAMLILGGFMFIYQMTATDHSNEHLNYFSKDILFALDAIPITALNVSFVQEEILNGNITALHNSLLEQIAEYWARGELEKAENLSTIIFDKYIPEEYGLRINIKNTTLFEHPNTQRNTVVVARKMISGIDEGKPLQGSSSYGYLRNIKDKRSAAYAYFGGFVGQGDITVQLEPLPSDVTSSRITAITLEADMEREFNISINGILCTALSPTSGNVSVTQWDITVCNASLQPGINNFSLSFDSLNDAYVGGGFIRVDYETDEFQTNKSYTTTNYFFPEINGIINLFDAFYIPGNLQNMTIYLHYLANHSNETNNTLYLHVGNTTVYTDTNSTSIVTTTLDNTQLSSMLNYTLMSMNTVPLRLGFENLTYSTIYTGNADVVLVTDVSGSMDWNFTHDYSPSTQRNCDNPLINDLSTQRLSVAKCLDKDFTTGILNVTGNRLGLVSYDSGVDSFLAVTTDTTALETEIGMGVGSPVGYVAGGGTCICCGINEAYDILSHSLLRTILITPQDTWNYTIASLSGNISLDAQNRTWYDPEYALESSWLQGNAVLGYDGGIGGVSVDTPIGSYLYGATSIVNLWELTADSATPPVDFTSGLNSTANTYGIANPNDGWDWASGTFDHPGSFNWFGVSSGRLVLRVPATNSNDASGSFGVTVNITQAQYDVLVSNGSASLSFDYWWDDYRNYFETDDQVWLKGRWTSPYSGAHMLGSQLDTDHNNGDASFEIDTRDNPNLDIVNEHFNQNIASFIEGPGIYYLELGGKLSRSASNEWGYFMYDNILLTITNTTDYYYFRKNIFINDLGIVQRGVVNVLADDVVRVYVNGNLVVDDGVNYNASYWDISGFNIPGNYFRIGKNVVAVALQNEKDSARFDLELIGINDSKDKAMMVMTDGDANYECFRQGWTPDLDGDGSTDTASDDAIQAACDAAQDYGILIYAVGFGQNANEATLKGIADCGNGLYRKSQNTSELQMFYQDVVLNILDVSRQSQSIVISAGTPTNSVLYPDSYVALTHTSQVLPPGPNEIELVFQTPEFNGCNATITIPQGLRVVDAKVTSYSGDHWTSLVQIDNITVFNLSNYAINYTHVGDPFIVQVPAHTLSSGTHTILMATGDNNQNTTGCSDNNTLIYTGFVNSSTARSSVVDIAVGCTWTVDFEDNSSLVFTVPQSYTGTKLCNYTASSHDDTLYTGDAYDIAVFDLLSQLDFDDDGRVFVNLAAEDLEIIVSLVNDVPYLWGPAIIGVEVWQ